MKNYQKDYKPSIEEVHHVHKLDAPSGTAITLAESLVEHSAYEGWKLDGGDEKNLSIQAIRKEEVPGIHTVQYQSDMDQISIKHQAFKRDGFALGAVIAAEWICGKQGIFSMDDVLKIS